MNKVITKEIELNGQKIKLETGKLALQADASVMASLGETVVLVTVATKVPTQDIGYFPLSVEYVEKHYAAGRITPQKFIKREGRPTEKSILAGRAIDRSIRPLFPKDFKNEVQVIISVLSYDEIHDPVLLGFIGTSAALSISSVPFAGPLGAIRMGMKGDEAIVNPTNDQMEGLDLELLVASTSSKVAMIEAEGRQVKEDVMFENIKKAFEEAQPQIKFIEEFTKEAGKEKITVVPLAEQIDEKVMEEAKKDIKARIEGAMFGEDSTWHEATGDQIKQEFVTKYAESLTSIQIASLFDKIAKELMNDFVLNKGKRVDGRDMGQVRALHMEMGLLPRSHGSALFQRGGTEVLSIATLGSLALSQTLEGMEGESTKRFMHHYNMGINPFSTGEVKRIGSPNRRDIGHGSLVEKSMEAVLPSTEDFPYAIRVVSEVLGANASSSQASVCASSLALINAGVPIELVAGIAMGLLSKDDKFQVFTDMQAVEDFYGEMDFKIAGTKNGITGIQMDTKLQGLTFEIVEEALKQGKDAREKIIAEMEKVMPKEVTISQYAPKIKTMNILPEEIGLLIGSGGKTINSIISRTGAQIDIQDDGTVMVSSSDEEAINKALTEIEGMFKKVAINDEFDGKVVRLAPFGAFVEIVPGKDGLVHVSQMAAGRVEKPEDVVSEGQTVHVRVIDVDQQGKIALSMLFGADQKPETERRPAKRFDGNGGGGGSRDGGRPSYNRDNRSDSRPSRGGGSGNGGGGTRRRFGK